MNSCYYSYCNDHVAFRVKYFSTIPVIDQNHLWYMPAEVVFHGYVCSGHLEALCMDASEFPEVFFKKNAQFISGEIHRLNSTRKFNTVERALLDLITSSA